MHHLLLQEVATQRAQELRDRGAEVRRARRGGPGGRDGVRAARRLRHVGFLLSRR